MSWKRRFDDPIVLPGTASSSHSKTPATTSPLPKAEQNLEEWQAAVESLMLVVELGGPTMFARIGIMRAVNRHVERVFDPSRKDKYWGRRKLARDQ
jgi:cob(I)alamin adenosyltransferase